MRLPLVMPPGLSSWSCLLVLPPGLASGLAFWSCLLVLRPGLASRSCLLVLPPGLQLMLGYVTPISISLILLKGVGERNLACSVALLEKS